MTPEIKKALDLALEALEENHHLIEEHERPEYLAHYDRVISAVSKARSASVQKGAIGAEYQKSPWDGKGISMPPPAAPVQEPFDHQQAASAGLRESMNRSVVIAKNTVPTLQKRPPNCGTGYCSCVECVMEPEPVQTDAWPCVIAEADFEQNTVTLEMQCSDYKVGAGQHWLHTTPPAAPDLQAELNATNRQVEILSDALAESRREVDAMVALARADEREVVEDLFQEYDMVDSAFARDFRARSCPPCNEDCDQGRNCPARKDK
jgi:hypothetical protein